MNANSIRDKSHTKNRVAKYFYYLLSYFYYHRYRIKEVRAAMTIDYECHSDGHRSYVARFYPMSTYVPPFLSQQNKLDSFGSVLDCL